MERAAAHRAAPARAVPLWAVWTAVAAVIAARTVGVAESETLATFGVIFTSIVVEALPFILLGAAASAAIAVWVPARAFARVSRLPAPLQVPAAAAAGFAMPVCECGSVPVARRLILRGLSPSAGIAFMLAAPILNPIVLASTWVAYGAAGKAAEMTAARAGLGLLVAVLAGTLPRLIAGTPPAEGNRTGGEVAGDNTVTQTLRAASGTGRTLSDALRALH